MMYEQNTVRTLYKKLLRLYPRVFREQLGESMEQTFNDLCRERYEAGSGLFGFVIWAFVDTLAGIIKENIKKENMIFMMPILRKHGAVLIYVITAIAIPITAYLLKGTEYENVWLYILAVGFVLAGAFEMYSKLKDRDKS